MKRKPEIKAQVDIGNWRKEGEKKVADINIVNINIVNIVTCYNVMLL